MAEHPREEETVTHRPRLLNYLYNPNTSDDDTFGAFGSHSLSSIRCGAEDDGMQRKIDEDEARYQQLRTEREKEAAAKREQELKDAMELHRKGRRRYEDDLAAMVAVWEERHGLRALLDRQMQEMILFENRIRASMMRQEDNEWHLFLENHQRGVQELQLIRVIAVRRETDDVEALLKLQAYRKLLSSGGKSDAAKVISNSKEENDGSTEFQDDDKKRKGSASEDENERKKSVFMLLKDKCCCCCGQENVSESG